jgi:hypothetical protein
MAYDADACLNQSYTAHVDSGAIDEDTMTDQGILVKDLEPIGDCYLSPGDPSPIGRTADGDLAYVVLPDEDHLRLKRRDAATLAMLLAQHLGITATHAIGDTLLDGVLSDLLHTAAPSVLFDGSAHGQVDHTATLEAILTQGAAALPDFLLP